MSAYHTYQTTRHFSSLDGLRCLSILAVIWHHTTEHTMSHITLLNRGYMGVDLFFVISGFLITTLLLREKNKTGRIHLVDFYIRRSLRIFPLYYTIIAVYILLVFIIESNSAAGQAFFNNLPYFLTYTSNIFVSLDGRVIFFFAWSLAAEEQFYLVWPTIEKYLSEFSALIIIASLFILVEATSYQWINKDTLLGSILVHVVPPICLGVFAAHLLSCRHSYEFLYKFIGQHYSSSILLIILLLSLAFASELMIHLSMALFVSSCVVREDHHLSSLLKWPPFVKIGQVSYGMYLMHMLAFNVIKKLMLTLPVLNTPLLLFFTTTGLTFTGAYFSFYYYESYFLRMKQRFEHIPANEKKDTLINASKLDKDKVITAKI